MVDAVALRLLLMAFAGRVLICDRDAKWSALVRGRLGEAAIRKGLGNELIDVRLQCGAPMEFVVGGGSAGSSSYYYRAA